MKLLAAAGELLEVGSAFFAGERPQEEDAQERGTAMRGVGGVGQPPLELGAPRVGDAVLAAVARAGTGDLDQTRLIELGELAVDLALPRGPDDPLL